MARGADPHETVSLVPFSDLGVRVQWPEDLHLDPSQVATPNGGCEEIGAERASDLSANVRAKSSGERSISVPSLRTPLPSKCSASPLDKVNDFKAIQEIHQIGAVMRSGEYRPWETASGPPGPGGSAQPIPHNPRIQREN